MRTAPDKASSHFLAWFRPGSGLVPDWLERESANLISIVAWPGEHFEQIVCFDLISKITMFIF